MNEITLTKYLVLRRVFMSGFNSYHILFLVYHRCRLQHLTLMDVILLAGYRGTISLHLAHPLNSC